jgi:putative transposase
MILGLIDEAVTAGARQASACELLGLDVRTVQRWREQAIGEDRRAGPKRPPANRLSSREEQEIFRVVNAPEYRDLSPKQLVPILADQDIYLASESTIYRRLRQAGQMAHRQAARPPQRRHRPTEYVASGPKQVWSWDITYLKGPIRGSFFYLYMVVDVWSRKIVEATVHASESSAHASRMIDRACEAEGVDRDCLVLHADNGSPMKGSTMLATLQALGIVPSFSRPRVYDDNPYSEALFRTVKYCPAYPTRGFASLVDAGRWVREFVSWYNTEHRHSAIRYVTPEQRHRGEETKILRRRRALYARARAERPERWSGAVRNWTPVKEVRLNPEPSTAQPEAA